MKKTGSLTLNKIIVIVLVLLVIAVVLFTIFKADILNYLRSLPAWTYVEEDIEEDYSSMSDKEISERGWVREKIGEVVLEKRGILKQYHYIYVNGLKTNLYYYKDKAIYLDRWNDFLIGEVKNNKIKIYDEYLDVNSESFRDYEELPRIYVLRLLHGAYKSKLNNDLFIVKNAE